jgi:hypothetical protein
MKRKALSLLLGSSLAILTAPNPAFARATSGYNSFKVWMASKNQFKATYGCLTESFGAVVNNCAFPVSLLFEITVENAGSHTVTVQNYFKGNDAENTFTCQTFGYDGVGGIMDGTVINFQSPTELLTSTISVPTANNSIQLICKDIPKGGGVANISWNP